ETASYQKWMLYLHPTQRQHVDRDFPGPARLAGVSGSGKTSVLIHRALRLADRYQGEPVLILTLNSALARLIDRLVDAARGPAAPSHPGIGMNISRRRGKAGFFHSTRTIGPKF